MTQRVTSNAAESEVSADSGSRTIHGLAIPLLSTTKYKGGYRFAFARDSVAFGERTPVLLGHDAGRPVGRLIRSEWTDRGLEVDLQVSKTSAGDDALQLAADGVLALSVGFDIPERAMTAQGDVINIWQAIGNEISLVSIPAFEDALVHSVSLSQDEGVTVPMTETTEVAPSVTVNLDAEKLGDTIAQAFSKLPIPQAQPVARLEMVREESPYRFDAEKSRFIGGGAHDFSSDIIAGTRGDAEAMARANGFLRMQFDVDTSNVTSLNPTRNRPDLFVDQRAYQFPIYTAVNSGTLTDITPFVFPRFSSASGLVAAHTEGVEPAPGSYAATSQTVQPQAVSGKIELTREVYDQGGNPQVSNLIWAKMQRAWYEALESKVVATLDAASPTAIAITAAAANGDLQAALVSAFSQLQFIRGGFAFDTFAVQVDLYKALAGAVDDSGRALFPMIGPINSLGTAQARYAAMDVAGVRAFPSWALAATGTTTASSYLFDSGSVHAWASAPQRIDWNFGATVQSGNIAQLAEVTIGIWGYAAAAISDLTGVREVTYDPTA